MTDNVTKNGSGNGLGDIDAMVCADPVGKLFKITEVCAQLSLSRATIYRLLKDAENPFPQPVKIGMASRWLESEINAWKEKLAADRAA